MKEKLYRKAEELVILLKNKNLTIATAESCTGGMVSEVLTEISGVSSVFNLGITSYTNEIKNKILGVHSETLDNFGAVSAETACEMAENVSKLANSDIGVSVTGVAGPSASEGHNPGYVFIAVSFEDKRCFKLLNIEPKSREFIRESAVYNLLELVIGIIKENDNG